MIKAFRMHPFQIITSFITLLKKAFVFILLLFVFRFGDTSTFIQIARGVFLIYLFIRTIFIIINWWKTTYEIHDGMILIRRGIFQRKQNNIPLQEIQNIMRNTPIYYNWVNLTSLRLETSSSSDSATVYLDAIGVRLAGQIEEIATSYNPEKSYAGDENDTLENEMEIETEDHSTKEKLRTIHYIPSRKDVLKASFLSFSFLGFIPVIAIVYDKASKVIDIDKQAESLLHQLMNSWLFMTGAIIMLILFAVGFGMTRTFLKYGKYEIASDDARVFIKSGVLNEKSFSVKKANIQAIRIRRSALKKLLHFTDVQLISAGNDEDEDEDISSLYPFLPSEKVEGLLAELLPQFTLQNANRRLPKHSLFMKLLRIPWFWLTVTGLVIWLKPEWIWMSPVLFILIYLARFFNYRNTRYVWDEQGLQFKVDGLSTDIFITNRKKLIEVNVEQGILQRKFGLATINTVNRVKPVHHEELQDIPFTDSSYFLQWYKKRADEITVE